MGRYDELGDDDLGIRDLIDKWFPFDGPYDADAVQDASAGASWLYYYLSKATEPEVASQTLAVDPITSLVFSTSAAVEGMSELVTRMQAAFGQLAKDGSVSDDRRVTPGWQTAHLIAAMTKVAAAQLTNAARLLARAATQADHLHDDEFAATTRATAMQLIRDEADWLYRGFHGQLCTRRLRLWEHITGDLTAVITERPDDGGTSITNAAEYVAAQLAREYPRQHVRIIEHYLDGALEPEHFDEVTVVVDTGTPRWRRLDPIDLAVELGPEFLAG